MMSDEAHFHLNGFVNKQNCRVWARENPKAIHERQLHPMKCTISCGVKSTATSVLTFFKMKMVAQQQSMAAAFVADPVA